MSTCLWFDTQAEEAANFYVSVFKNSKVGHVSHYAQDVQGKKAGSVMVVEFEINGQTFTALNGGPQYKFTEAVSFQVAAIPRRRLITSGASSARVARKAPAAG